MSLLPIEIKLAANAREALDARDQLAYDLLASTMFVIGLVGFFLDLGAQKVFRSITA